MKNVNSLLRKSLATNASFSLVCGSMFLIFSPELSAWMHIQDITVLYSLGPGLILFGLYVGYCATRQKPGPYHVWFIIIQDWIWVFGSAFLLITTPFGISLAGNWVIAIVATIVMSFAIAQYKGLQRVTRYVEENKIM